MLKSLVSRVSKILHRPVQVLWICLILAALSLFLDGSFIHLWSLHRDHDGLETRIAESKGRLKHLEFRIQEAQQPQFIEKRARDQFDLVKEGDLIFVFSDDAEDDAEGGT